MTSALRLRKHRTGGVLAPGGRSMGRSGPWIGAHSTASTNIVSDPRHCRKRGDGFGGLPG